MITWCFLFIIIIYSWCCVSLSVEDLGDDNVTSGQGLGLHALPHNLRGRITIQHERRRAARILILSKSAYVGDHCLEFLDSKHLLCLLLMYRVVDGCVRRRSSHGGRTFRSTMIRRRREGSVPLSSLIGVVWQGTVAGWDGFQARRVGTHVIRRNGISGIEKSKCIKKFNF